MVGIVIVSHSENLAKSVVELNAAMAPEAPMVAAGGMENGSFGTSFNKIKTAIEEAYSDDGVLILMDMGSAVMTTEMVIEMMPDYKIAMADCPLVEGAVVAAVCSENGMSFEEIQEELKTVGTTKKL